MPKKPKTNMTVGDHEYFRIQKTIGYEYVDGKKKQIQKTFTGHNKTEAQAKYDAWVKDQKGYEAKDLFGELGDYFNDSVLKNNDTMAEGTILLYRRAYQMHVRTHGELMATPISSVDIKMLQGLIFDLGTEVKSRPINTLKWLKAFYKWASASGYCTDISRALVTPRFETPKREIEVWDDASVKILLDHMKKEDHRLRFLVILALNTGLRIGEILALEYGDIQNGNITVDKQLQRGTIVPPKSPESYRTVPMNDTVKAELKKYKKWHEAEMKSLGYTTKVIFTTNTGNYISYESLNHSLKRLYKRIKATKQGKKFTPHRIHAFRATFATKLAKNNVRLDVARRLLGHSSIEITAKYYTKIDDHDKLDAVNLI